MIRPDPTLRAIIQALRMRFDSTSSSLRDLEREIASLSASERRKRLSEFDARTIALLKESDNIAKSIRAFLRPKDYPEGHA